MSTERVAQIAKLNDEFRKAKRGIVVTPGIRGLGDLSGLLDEIGSFKDFNEDNDPHGEHDFGAVFWHGQRIFWKIDYYDQSMKGWCDPLSAECRRVMTVMLAREY